MRAFFTTWTVAVYIKFITEPSKTISKANSFSQWSLTSGRTGLNPDVLDLLIGTDNQPCETETSCLMSSLQLCCRTAFRQLFSNNWCLIYKTVCRLQTKMWLTQETQNLHMHNNIQISKIVQLVNVHWVSSSSTCCPTVIQKWSMQNSFKVCLFVWRKRYVNLQKTIRAAECEIENNYLNLWASCVTVLCLYLTNIKFHFLHICMILSK